MKTVIRPETEMKDSGIEWIGDIPKDWNSAPIKVNFDIYAGATPSSNNPIYWDGDIAWITPADYKTEDKYVSCGKRHISQDGYDNCSAILVPANSIIFSKRAPIGTVAISKNELCTNQGCLSCVSKDDSNIEFYYYAMSIATEEFELKGSGTTFKEISLANFKNFRFAVPPLSEQQAIADYLDETCSKIDEIIAEAKASIDEYKKLRQGIIFEAVTKGLDKNVEMKSTSVGWIGTVPSHWRVAKIRQVAEFYNGDRSSKYPSGNDIVSEGIIFITSNNLGYIVLNTNISTNKFITKQKYDDLGGAKLRINDIVFCLRGSVGKCAINKTFDEGTIASSLVVIRAKKVDADYLNYVLQNHRITDEAIVNAIGIGSLNLAAHDISEFYMPIPPEREMQDIVRYLDDKVGNVDDLISEKESLINDLEAYKKSLIYEVVTGKRKVV